MCAVSGCIEKQWDTGDTMTVILDCDKCEIEWILCKNHRLSLENLKPEKTSFGPFKITGNKTWYAMIGWDGNNGVLYELVEE